MQQCFLDGLRAFGINTDQSTTAAQDEGKWRRKAEQGSSLPASACSIFNNRLNLVLTRGIPPDFRDGGNIYRQPPPCQPQIHRVT